jgi:hypothetical protein
VTIDDMIAETPEGETRTYARRHEAGDAPERFLAIGKNYEYAKPRFSWTNQPGRRELPRPSARHRSALSFDHLDKCDLRFEGKIKKLADFYPIVGGPCFISRKLLDVIRDLDPEAITYRAEVVQCVDANAEFYLAIPARVLQAIDTARTEVRIRDEDLGGTFFRRVDFPSGILLSKTIDPSVHAFWEYNDRSWMWSRALVGACGATGIRGLRANKTDDKDPGDPVFL